MAEITAKDVAGAPQATGAGILDCREALQRERRRHRKGAALAARAGPRRRVASARDRERAEGAVSVVVTGDGDRRGRRARVRDRLRREVGRVRPPRRRPRRGARRPTGEEGIAAHEAEIDELKVTLKENIALGAHERFEAADGDVLESYLHVQNGRGVNGVLVELAGGTAELAHDIAVHIAFARPEYLRRDDVPAEAVAAERETIAAIARNEGKPEAQLDKIVEGRLNGWYKERVLLEQPYARDDKKTIAQVLGGATVRRFAQVVVGA